MCILHTAVACLPGGPDSPGLRAAVAQGDALTRACEAAAGALVAQQMVGCRAVGPGLPGSPERALWWELLSQVRRHRGCMPDLLAACLSCWLHA